MTNYKKRVNHINGVSSTIQNIYTKAFNNIPFINYPNTIPSGDFHSDIPQEVPFFEQPKIRSQNFVYSNATYLSENKTITINAVLRTTNLNTKNFWIRPTMREPVPLSIISTSIDSLGRKKYGLFLLALLLFHKLILKIILL